MTVHPCSGREKAAILAILNEAILHTTALYEYEPRTMAMMDAWFEEKERGGWPVIGAFDEGGELAGFATYGPFRNRPAYKYTVEHSVYVRDTARGKGVGRLLLEKLIEAAAAQDCHVLVAGIDAENAVSIGLHERLGFRYAGRIAQAGFKFGRWLDLVFYQLTLETPAHPVDG